MISKRKKRQKESRPVCRNSFRLFDFCLVGGIGFEPTTSTMSTRRLSVVSDDIKALTTTPANACTSACTSEPENCNAIDVEQLADQLRAVLSNDECRRLADLLNDPASGPMGDS